MLQPEEHLTEHTPVQVRSHRRAQWCWIDNAVIDTYGQTLGPIGIALYVALCRHASSTTGRCWPSLGRLSRQIGVTHLTARRALKKLVELGLIEVEPRPGTTAMITLLDMPDSPLPGNRVSEEVRYEVTGGSYEVTGGPLPCNREPDFSNQTNEPSPKPPEDAGAVTREETPPAEPLHTTLATLLAVWDEATRTRLYDYAKATLVDEGVSPWHLIQPVIEARMLALWEVQTQDRGTPQRQEAAA